MNKQDKALAKFLNEKVLRFNRPEFIEKDPVSIPHIFRKKQDIEIAGFFAAVFSWGNRTTIIQKSKELLRLMDNAPHEFCLYASEKELKKISSFKHRTFNATDLLYFIEFFNQHYSSHKSLENAFTRYGTTPELMLRGFHDYFFSLEDAPQRTKKHVSTPSRNASCKRLNMFLRWMVRKDDSGVDLGIWNGIDRAHLIIPLDVHVGRVSRKLGLLQRKQTDWKAALELTEQLRKLDPADPVKYDFALFGMGINEK